METEINKSVRILFVAPYESLGSLFQKLIAKYSQFSTDVVIGDLEEGVKRTKECLERESYDLIVSRGGTSELLKTITQIPVIQVPITTSDVLMALKLNRTVYRKICRCGFPQYNKICFRD